MAQVGSGEMQAIPGESLNFARAEMGHEGASGGASDFFNGLLYQGGHDVPL